MARHGKKYNAVAAQIDKDASFSLKDALVKSKELAYAKFDESVDVHVNLGIDPTKGEQAVRGSVVLPYGTGKKTRIIVFAKGDNAEQAKKAGADFVGAEDLIEKISNGWLDFEYAVATPDLMGMVGKVAKILGPQGKMPSKKNDTVTFNVVDIVSRIKQGLVFFNNDKAGIVHFTVGKKSFDVEKLQHNVAAFFKALASAKPPTSKGKFLKKVTLTTTMGVGLQVNPDDVLKAD